MAQVSDVNPNDSQALAAQARQAYAYSQGRGPAVQSTGVRRLGPGGGAPAYYSDNVNRGKIDPVTINKPAVEPAELQRIRTRIALGDFQNAAIGAQAVQGINQNTRAARFNQLVEERSRAQAREADQLKNAVSQNEEQGRALQTQIDQFNKYADSYDQVNYDRRVQELQTQIDNYNRNSQSLQQQISSFNSRSQTEASQLEAQAKQIQVESKRIQAATETAPVGYSTTQPINPNKPVDIKATTIQQTGPSRFQPAENPINTISRNVEQQQQTSVKFFQMGIPESDTQARRTAYGLGMSLGLQTGTAIGVVESTGNFAKSGAVALTGSQPIGELFGFAAPLALGPRPKLTPRPVEALTRTTDEYLGVSRNLGTKPGLITEAFGTQRNIPRVTGTRTTESFLLSIERPPVQTPFVRSKPFTDVLLKTSETETLAGRLARKSQLPELGEFISLETKTVQRKYRGIEIVRERELPTRPSVTLNETFGSPRPRPKAPSDLKFIENPRNGTITIQRTRTVSPTQTRSLAIQESASELGQVTRTGSIRPFQRSFIVQEEEVSVRPIFLNSREQRLGSSVRSQEDQRASVGLLKALSPRNAQFVRFDSNLKQTNFVGVTVSPGTASAQSTGQAQAQSLLSGNPSITITETIRINRPRIPNNPNTVAIREFEVRPPRKRQLEPPRRTDLQKKKRRIFEAENASLIQGFNVVGRRRGKEFLIARNQTFGRANLEGVRFASGTLGRSFKVVPGGLIPSQQDIGFRPSQTVFARAKSKRLAGFQVQRSRYALSSPSEKREIQQSRRRRFYGG